MLSSPRSIRSSLAGGAVALLATVALTAPANAATTIESSGSSAGATSFNFTNYSWGATGLNFTQPVDYERKAGG